jgi:hypothetical protein
MEQRHEPRFVADQSVVVTVLGEHETQHSATIRNASGRGLAIEMPISLLPGTALKLEFEDSIVLGESVYCRSGPGSYLLGVQLDQMLCGLIELRSRLQEFAPREASGTEVPHSVNHGPCKNHQQAQEQ